MNNIRSWRCLYNKFSTFKNDWYFGRYILAVACILYKWMGVNCMLYVMPVILIKLSNIHSYGWWFFFAHIHHPWLIHMKYTLLTTMLLLLLLLLDSMRSLLFHHRKYVPSSARQRNFLYVHFPTNVDSNPMCLIF